MRRVRCFRQSKCWRSCWHRAAEASTTAATAAAAAVAAAAAITAATTSTDWAWVRRAAVWGAKSAVIASDSTPVIVAATRVLVDGFVSESGMYLSTLIPTGKTLCEVLRNLRKCVT